MQIRRLQSVEVSPSNETPDYNLDPPYRVLEEMEGAGAEAWRGW